MPLNYVHSSIEGVTIFNPFPLRNRAVFDRVALFDDDVPLAVDWDFWLLAARAYPFDYVDEPLVLYRTGHADLSCRYLERHLAVGRIMRRFHGQGGRALVSRPVLRAAWTEFSYHMALRLRPHSRLAALGWYLRTPALSPGYRLAWCGLSSLPLPESWRRRLPRTLGRQPDWIAPPPVKSIPSSPLQGRTMEPCRPRA
jgi:hypothetical protein